MPSLRDQLLELEGGKKTDDEPQKTQTQTQQKSKEDNLAALRKAKEDQENLLKTLQGENESLKQKAAKLEDEKFKKLLTTLETEFEDNPEKLLESYTTLKTTSTEWETKLKEKEDLLEKTAFEKSEAYKKNVELPVRTAEERLKGVIKKDDALYAKLKKQFVYDKDGKVATGPLNADEIIALDEVLEDFDGIKPERVAVAIEALREGFHSANDYYNNFKSKLQESEAERQKQLAAKNAEEAGIAKLARAHGVRTASAFLSDEALKGVFSEEFLTGLPKVVLGSVENSIASKTVPSLEDMAKNQFKARLFDELVSQGGLDLLKNAIEVQASHSKGSDGTRSQSKAPEKKLTGSVLDILSKQHGVDRRMRQ